MHFGSALFLGIAVNFDNLCLGLSCGMAGKRIPWYHNLIIAVVSGLSGGLSCAVSYLIPERFSFVSALIGSLILCGVGLWTVIQAVFKCENTCDYANCFTSLREVLLLSVALASNCLAVSFGMGLSDVPCHLLGISMAMFSFVGVGAGNLIGQKTAHLVRSKLFDILSGLLLIAVALWEWLI